MIARYWITYFKGREIDLNPGPIFDKVPGLMAKDFDFSGIKQRVNLLLRFLG
jgi:hypothetical protein